MVLDKCIEKLSAGEDVTILVLGDSLTQGWMVRKGYVDFLFEMLRVKYPGSNITMINKGVPGDTSESGLYRVGRGMLEANPDLVIVQFGLNDLFMGYSPDTFQSNIDAIVAYIKNNSFAEILLISSVPVIEMPVEDKIADIFYAKLCETAKREMITFAEIHTYWKSRVSEGINNTALVQADMVHPNIEGYRIMAEAVFEAF